MLLTQRQVRISTTCWTAQRVSALYVHLLRAVSEMDEPILLQSLGPTPLQTPLTLSASRDSFGPLFVRSERDEQVDFPVHRDELVSDGRSGAQDNTVPADNADTRQATSLPDYIPALPPVDGGRQAWSFLVAATTMEMLIWGLPFSVGVLHEYWLSTLFQGQGEGTITLAATLQTGLLYMSTAAFGP